RAWFGRAKGRLSPPQTLKILRRPPWGTYGVDRPFRIVLPRRTGFIPAVARPATWRPQGATVRRFVTGRFGTCHRSSCKQIFHRTPRSLSDRRFRDLSILVDPRRPIRTVDDEGTAHARLSRTSVDATRRMPQLPCFRILPERRGRGDRSSEDLLFLSGTQSLPRLRLEHPHRSWCVGRNVRT